MARRRWLAPWKDSLEKPSIYHLISRVVDRRMAFGHGEKARFRALMRMTEDFTGCRVLSYCLMSNHFHILLEVPPRPSEPIPDIELFRRLAIFYPTWKVDEQRRLLSQARESGNIAETQRLLDSHTYRMHDLSEFMKILLQRFTTWFNRRNQRSGRLWEQRFKSVLVESGFAAQTVAAYIDLNPVRAGLCEDPIDYRWSSYAEAAANGRKARAGLVRIMEQLNATNARCSRPPAWQNDLSDLERQARAWSHDGLASRYRLFLLGKSTQVERDGRVVRKGMNREKARHEMEQMKPPASTRNLAISKVIRNRVRYFTDGAVIGSKDFVEDAFQGSRSFFGNRRQSGARKPRGSLAGLSGDIWSARDLRKDVG